MTDASTPTISSQTLDPPIQGCCSGDDARTFQDNDPFKPQVEQLQRDLREAACVGQALLARHEAYVADAESRHKTDSTTITTLTDRASTLETENARLKTENNELFTQLETLNNALEESDSRVKGLTATLRETQNELARMRMLAARAERLEQQLVQVEMERQILLDTVTKSEDEERRATARWRASERALKDLEVQVESMEAEARQEQEAQREIAERAERQKQIQNAIEANRKRVENEASSGSQEVIASFVKEILEDNAGLQLDLTELREMLLRSQEEAEDLRQQVSLASPMPRTDPLATPTGPRGLDLSTELLSQVQGPTRELHIHHHIHAPTAPSPLSTSAPQRPPRLVPARHRRHMSSRSSIMTLHSRHESTASSAPSTIFEQPSSASEAGYETDGTNFTRPTSPDSESPAGMLSPFSPFAPLDEVLEEASKRPRSRRRRGSNESVLSVSGMDIHTTPLPSPSRNWSVPGSPSGRPVLSKNYASASSSSLRTFKAGESAAGQALRRRLEERERERQKRYNPVRDTLGAWFSKGGKGKEGERRSAARVRVECVDEEGLRECLEEDENES